MAIQEIRVSDLSGEHDAEKHHITLDNHGGDVDLTETEFKELLESVRHYIDAARRPKTVRRAPATNHRGPDKDARTPQERRDYYAWAASHGRQVVRRGRIPRAHWDAYLANDPSAVPAAEHDDSEPATSAGGSETGGSDE